MVQVRNLIIRTTLITILVLIALFSATQSARADGIIQGDTVSAGQVVDNDAFMAGDDIVMDGTIKGDLFAFGRTVTINGDVDGSLFTAGGEITINGEIRGTVYSVGRVLEMGPQSSADRNVYFVGLQLITQEGSTIGRDLLGASLSAKLSGTVVRDLKAVIGLLSFLGEINQSVEEGQSEPEPEPDTSPSGSLDSQENAAADLGGVISLVRTSGKGEPIQMPAKELLSRSLAQGFQKTIREQEISSYELQEWLIELVRDFVTLLIIGLVAIWLLPSRLELWGEKLRAKPLPAAGYGLLGLIVAANAVIVVTLLAAIILAIGLGLGFITIWDLAFIFWALAYSSLAFTTTLFFVFVVYISKIIAAYLAGLLIVKALIPKTASYRIVPLLLGLVIYVLLASVPYIGWAIALIATILGLGAVGVAFRDKRVTAIQNSTETINEEQTKGGAVAEEV
jgi:cytoskeletal protein CcmA (bactofilin family)